MADPKLVERILKLYALAAGTSFSAEAETARRMAESLIAKHNVQLPSNKDRGAFARVYYTPYFPGALWEYMLAETACKLTGCAIYYLGPGDGPTAYWFAGTTADLEACQYLLAILHEQRMRDWMTTKRQGSADKFYSFCFSFARGVEANAKTATEQAVPKRIAEARAWYDANYHPAIGHVPIHGQGRSETGRAAGQAASLHRGNITQPPPKRLK